VQTDDSTTSIVALLGANAYPGRLLAIGRDVAGELFMLYGLTGRSEASRLRELVIDERSLEVRDLSDGPNDSLRHYRAAVVDDRFCVLGNGTHVDELQRDMRDGRSFGEAFQRISYEPDAPLFTPRIAGCCEFADPVAQSAVTTAAALSHREWPEVAQQASLHVASLMPGQALALSTYRGSRQSPQPGAAPASVGVNLAWNELADHVWRTLPSDLRVAVVTARITRGAFGPWVVVDGNS
jgi:IMP cyclohydrolase